jgi:Zn-dependent protease
MFGRGIKLFNLMGFEVRLHSSWFILGALVVFSLAGGFFPYRFPGYSQADYWWMAIAGAVGLLLSIVVHEFAHSVVARRFGIPMRGITLFIFGGVAEMGDEPPSAKSEFLMAIAGPLTSFAVAGCSYIVARVLSVSGAAAIAPVFAYLAWINGLLGLFNLIPAYPLDGGRVLRSAVWAKKRDIVAATRIASRIGSGFGILLMLLGVWTAFQGSMVSGIWWILIGMFVRNASVTSYRQVLYREAMQQRHMQDLLEAERSQPYIDVEATTHRD